jgi:hypothetical protein
MADEWEMAGVFGRKRQPFFRGKIVVDNGGDLTVE